MNELTETLTTWLAEHGIPEWLIPFLVSILPLIELRGGIIAAKILGMELWKAIWVCMIGNILPIPIILLFIDKIFEFIKKHKIPLLAKFIVYLEEKAMNKSSKMEKGEFWFLLLFVGIPLPGTGAWTGSLIAALRKIPLKKAVPAIFLGLCLASAIMCTLCYGFPELFTKMFG
ncbi:MAG: small multi-drug export protein [Ruminococcus sp.]|nr:small multi-drug export protein [Ruminococcus sp.]MDE7097862.1 small multi-drug export protein [Ruminococcus sp.]